MKLGFGEIISKIEWPGVCDGSLLDYEAFCEDFFCISARRWHALNFWDVI